MQSGYYTCNNNTCSNIATTLDAGTGVDQTAAQMGEDKVRSSSLQRWVSETVLNRERNWNIRCYWSEKYFVK